MQFKDYSGTDQFRPLSAWAYFGYALLFAIPIVGWIFLLIFTFSTKNYNRRSFARSYWCGFLVAAIVIGSLLALREWMSETPERISVTVSPTIQPTRTIGNAATNATQLGSNTTETATPTQTTTPPTDGVTPEFKQTMDEYEAFFDSYIEFMEGFDADNASFTQLAKYAEMMTQYAETMAALDKIEDSATTEADDQYYIEVTLRVNQKLASFAATQ